MKMLIQIASVFTLLYRGLLQAICVMALRTQATSWSAKERQRGATALEYIVLAAAVIIIVGVLAASGVGETLVDAFTDLFTDATNVQGPGGGD